MITQPERAKLQNHQGKGENWLSRPLVFSPLPFYLCCAGSVYCATLLDKVGNESVVLLNQRVPQPLELIGIEINTVSLP